MLRRPQITGNVLRRYREEGVGGLWGALRTKFGGTREYIAYVKMLTPETALEEHPVATFRLAVPADIPWICDSMTHLGKQGRALLEQQFKDEDMTVIGFLKEQEHVLTYVAWLAHADVGMDLVSESVHRGDCSIRRIWVPPAYRRMEMATAGQLFGENQAASGGAMHLWSFVLTDNLASRRLHEKLGYREHGMIRLVKRLRWRYAIVQARQDNRWIRVPIPKGVTKL